MGASAQLEIIIRAIDESAAGFANVASGLDETGKKAISAQEQVKQLGEALTEAGVAFTGIGAAVTAGIGETVKAATDSATAHEQLNTKLQALIATAQQDIASKDADAAATQKLDAQHASLTARITLEQEAYQKAVDRYGVGSAQAADAAAKLQTYQASLDKVNEALQQHQNLLDLATESTAALSAQFTSAADANVKLGFDVTDSINSFDALVGATHDVTQAMQLNALAMDLARNKNEDLGTATTQIVQILEGGGRAAKQFGINMSETATPAQALAQLTQMLGGQAQAYADGPAGKAAIAQAEWNKTLEDAGTTILPIIDSIIEKIGGLVSWIDAFVEAHPKLTAAVLIGAAVFGGLLLVLGSIMLVIGPLLIAFGTMGGVVALAGVAVAAAIAAMIAAFVAFHTQIAEHWQAIVQILIPGIGSIVVALANNWKTIQSDAAAFWNGLVTFVSNIVNQLEGIISSFVSKIQSMFDAVMHPIQSITGAVSGVGSMLGSGASSLLSMVPHFATGGIVNGPTMALVGEAGPEAIIPLSAFAGGGSFGGGEGGGSAGINIYIQGGNYLDSNGATMIADAIGKQIMRQMRLKNFS